MQEMEAGEQRKTKVNVQKTTQTGETVLVDWFLLPWSHYFLSWTWTLPELAHLAVRHL